MGFDAHHYDKVGRRGIARRQVLRGIVLRIRFIREIPNHLVTNHPQHRCFGFKKRGGMDVAAHLFRAEKRRFLQAVGHKLDAVSQVGLFFADQSGRLQ